MKIPDNLQRLSTSWKSNMQKIGQSLVLMLLSVSSIAHANFDYFEENRQMIRNGVQAILSCNGLFTSNRSIDQVFKSELAYLGDRVVGNSNTGNYAIDTAAKWVGVGGGDHQRVHAVFREGIGCIVVPPDWDLADNTSLPIIDLSYRTPTSHLPWPMGDVTESKILPSYVNAAALQAAERWAFERNTPEQNTVSLLVVHKGDIILERYADGFDRTTRTRTWSTAKSIAATLIGMKVDAGELSLDAPLGFNWLPEVTAAETDPRNKITLRHTLHMSSGLYPVDSFGMEYATGSGLAYWAGASSIEGMRNRGLIREPGTFWDYENYDTLLAVYALKKTFKGPEEYLTYPHSALFDQLGMTNTLASTDRFGDFIFSSQVYTNARDLARFGMLYLQNGVWQGKRLLSEDWIEFIRSPAPASSVRGSDYGGHWWLVPDDRKGEVPSDAYSTAGNRGQYVIVVPSHDLVIVRRGLDFGKQGFNRWDLLREVLTAFPAP
jgi:CubicO group peptidase (beta-lactamase class C family)